jgi:hypothetical protein
MSSKRTCKVCKHLLLPHKRSCYVESCRNSIPYKNKQKEEEKKKKRIERENKKKMRFRDTRGRKNALKCDISQRFVPNITSPTFKKSDRLKKLKICGLKDENACAICGNTRQEKAQGDHLWGRLEYYQSTRCYGIIDSLWNKLPVCPRCNTSYKKIILTNGIKKNIGRDELTEVELELVEQKDKKKVNMVRAWKAYVKKKGAILCFRCTEQEEKYIAEAAMRRDAYIIYEEERLQKFMEEERNSNGRKNMIILFRRKRILVRKRDEISC